METVTGTALLPGSPTAATRGVAGAVAGVPGEVGEVLEEAGRVLGGVVAQCEGAGAESETIVHLRDRSPDRVARQIRSEERAPGIVYAIDLFMLQSQKQGISTLSVWC